MRRWPIRKPASTSSSSPNSASAPSLPAWPKCHADVVLISGYDGGTGAAPLNAIKHAGTPWEIGLSETQQTLVLNGLRSRITVQCDGELKTGRDVVIAALLGAEGIRLRHRRADRRKAASRCAPARRTPARRASPPGSGLRARFKGKPEHVVNFFMFHRQEVRELLAQLGFRTLEEAVGHVECLDQDETIKRWKSDGIDLSNVLMQPGGSGNHPAQDDRSEPRARQGARQQAHRACPARP